MTIPYDGAYQPPLTPVGERDEDAAPLDLPAWIKTLQQRLAVAKDAPDSTEVDDLQRRLDLAMAMFTEGKDPAEVAASLKQ